MSTTSDTKASSEPMDGSAGEANVTTMARLRNEWLHLDESIRATHLAINECRWYQYAKRRSLMANGLAMIYKARQIQSLLKELDNIYEAGC
jgi:hypothetical protein